MKSVFAQKISAGGESVFLVHGGKDTTGQESWFFVDVPSPKRAAFLRGVKSGSIDLTQFGTVLESGYGAHPHPSIISRMKAEYGYTGN